MDRKRRAFLQGLGPVAVAAPLGLLAVSIRAQMPGSQAPTPNPPGMPPIDENSPKIDPTAILKHNQQEIVDDAKKLFALATDLKDQVEKTDSANVLSLPLVRKAKEIEDLAKRIRTLAVD